MPSRRLIDDTGASPTAWQALFRRFIYLALVLLAVVLLVLGKVEAVLVEQVRSRIGDVAAPLLDGFSRPVDWMGTAASHLAELNALREENIRLREENARLMQWRVVARRLESENNALRDLMKLDAGPLVTFVSARIIGDTGGAFTRSVLINAGSRSGIGTRQPVINGSGLVGRTTSVGEQSAEVLLLTDLNSQVPVLVGERRDRAILAGDNTNYLRLIYPEDDMTAEPDDLVVTSGLGGVFPEGLPVGVVGGTLDDTVYVRPYVNWNRIEFVRVIDASLAGYVDQEAGE